MPAVDEPVPDNINSPPNGLVKTIAVPLDLILQSSISIVVPLNHKSLNRRVEFPKLYVMFAVGTILPATDTSVN